MKTLDEFYTDILTTAVEGGIGYWSAASSYDWDCAVEDRGVTLVIDDVSADEVVIPTITSDVDTVTVRLTLRDIDRGVKKVIGGAVPKTYSSLVENALTLRDTCPDNGLGDIDADVADIIVQVALFGKIIFG